LRRFKRASRRAAGAQLRVRGHPWLQTEKPHFLLPQWTTQAGCGSSRLPTARHRRNRRARRRRRSSTFAQPEGSAVTRPRTGGGIRSSSARAATGTCSRGGIHTPHDGRSARRAVYESVQAARLQSCLHAGVWPAAIHRRRLDRPTAVTIARLTTTPGKAAIVTHRPTAPSRHRRGRLVSRLTLQLTQGPEWQRTLEGAGRQRSSTVHNRASTRRFLDPVVSRSPSTGRRYVFGLADGRVSTNFVRQADPDDHPCRPFATTATLNRQAPWTSRASCSSSRSGAVAPSGPSRRAAVRFQVRPGRCVGRRAFSEDGWRSVHQKLKGRARPRRFPRPHRRPVLDRPGGSGTYLSPSGQ